MASLRELLDKQAAEKAAQQQQIAAAKIIPEEKGISLAETFTTTPTSPPPSPSPEKPKSSLSRFGVSTPKPNGQAVSQYETKPQQISAEKIPLAIGAVIVAATQDLPPASIEELRKNLDFLAENIDQKNLVGQVVRTIAVQLQENPQFSSSMKDTDFDLLVRGLRKSYNIAARRRVEAGEKKDARSEEVMELETMMKDLGVSLKF